jgi:hypothetical protein
MTYANKLGEEADGRRHPTARGSQWETAHLLRDASQFP